MYFFAVSVCLCLSACLPVLHVFDHFENLWTNVISCVCRPASQQSFGMLYRCFVFHQDVT